MSGPTPHEPPPAAEGEEDPRGPLVYPLSFSQQRLWFLDQLSPGGVEYNVSFGLRMRGPLDIDALRASLHTLVRRHDVLRTRLLLVDGEPCQVVYPDDELVIAERRSDVSPERFEAALARELKREAATPFVFSRDILVRASILQNGASDAALFLTLHHAVTDGWSLGVLGKELAAAYAAFRGGLKPLLPPLAIQYGDYAVWLREQAASDRLTRQLDFWRASLAGMPGLELPTDHPRPRIQTSQGALHTFRIPEGATRGVLSLARTRGVTPFGAFLAAWSVVLRWFSGQTDFGVGTPVANRQQPECELLIGFFVNTVTIRLDLRGDPTFAALLDRTLDAAFSAFAHQDVPFERVVAEVRPERDLGRSPLIQSMFALQDAPIGEPHLESLAVTAIRPRGRTALFDLSLSLTPQEGGFVGELQFNTDLFDEESIARVAALFLDVLTSAAEDPERSVSRLMRGAPPVSPEAQPVSAEPIRSLDEAIAARFAREPHAAAVIAESGRLTRGQLAAHAAGIALRLRALGGDGAIAVACRSLATRAAAVLGALEAGRRYTICAAEDDAGRGAWMMRAGARALVVDDAAAGKDVPPDTIVLRADTDDDTALPSVGRIGPERHAEGACIVPSSGADGAPVVVGQQAFGARLRAFERATGVADGDTVACAADDPYEFLLALALGATVVDADLGGAGHAESGPRHHEKVSVACLRGDRLDAWAAAISRRECPSLRAVVLDPRPSFEERLRWRRLYAVEAVERLCGAEAGLYAAPGCAVVVADASGEALPPGTPGELVFGGHGLADGFLGQPAATAACFVPEPAFAGGRGYRSGRRGRVWPDGRIDSPPHWQTHAKALPGAGERHEATKPPTPMEELVAGFFVEALRLNGREDVIAVGPDANFFQEGGHSLLAVAVLSRVRSVLGIDLPLRTMFEKPTIRQLAERLEEARGASEAGARVPLALGRAPRARLMPLSFAQERMWVLHELQPEGAAYNLPIALELKGLLNGAALHGALEALVARHEVLRTRFVVEAGEPWQEVLAASNLRLEVEDVANEDVQRRLQEEARQAFCLTAGPLLRARLLRHGSEAHVLLVTMHHIISDGWSAGVLVRELAELYAARVEEREPKLAPRDLEYVDYAAWQRSELNGPAGAEQAAYWRRQLAGAETVELPTDRPRPPVQSHRGATYDLNVPAELLRGLVRLGQQHGATLFMTLTAAWAALLKRWTGQTDLSIGTPVANRQRTELEGIVGLFVNTLVMRVDLRGDPTFVDLLSGVRDVTLEAYSHQDLPFERVVEELNPRRDLSRAPLFQVMFALQNAPAGRLELPGLSVSVLPSDTASSKFDLSLHFTERPDGLSGLVAYSVDLFDEETIARMMSALVAILREVVHRPDATLTALDISSDEERRELAAWNATREDFPSERSVLDLFEGWAAATPDAPALVDGELTLTYRQLDARAQAAANWLAASVRPGSLVGVCFERSAEMVVAMLAALKAGAGYVALDPEYPPERLARMIDDAGLRVVLTDSRRQAVASSSLRSVCLTDIEAAGARERQPRARPLPLSIAYVVYTSGSTGRPKGIAVSHRSILRTIAAVSGDVGPGDCVAQVANASFDMAPFEIWTALTSGARLQIVPREIVLSPVELAALVRAAGVTFLHLTTALFNLVSREAPEAFKGVRQLFFGGEAADAGAVERVLAGQPPRRLVNAYGPAENTMISTIEVWSGAAPRIAGVVPIGKPIGNTRVYLLDDALGWVPRGARGEIYVAGDGLAFGYWRRPDLTAERFVPDPFAASPGARMYRTGDVGRLRRDGKLEFIGRADFQLKIRGYRIEPLEICAVLREHPAVQDAFVWGDRDGGAETVLRACFTGRDDVATDDVRRHLRERLPAFMIPSSIARVDEILLTPNGKVDHARLPRGEASAPPSRPPATHLERELADIWSHVLGRADIGVDDDLFELGGHSLMASQICSRVRARLNVELPLRAVFDRPTIAGLAELLGGERVEPAVAPIGPAEDGAPPPLSFAQERLWLLDQLHPGSAAYNIPLALRLRGRLAREALAWAFDRLVERHESLRTRVVAEGGVAKQGIERLARPELVFEDLSSGPRRSADPSGPGEVEGAVEVRAREEAGWIFDLRRGPLVRASLLRTGEEEHVLLVTLHHIIADGWSVGILVRELGELYTSRVEGRETHLGALPIRYTDYAAWQRKSEQVKAWGAELEHWRARLAGAESLEMTTDLPRPAALSMRGATLSVRLPPPLVRALRAFGQGRNATLFMTVLAGWCAVLRRWTGQTDVSVGTPVANRPRSELEGLVGLFVNTVVIRADLGAAPSFAQLVDRVRATALDAYANQDVPFERVVEELRPKRDLTRSPLFQTMFALQNTPAGELRLPGVEVTLAPTVTSTTRFDLSLSLREDPRDDELAGVIEYSTDLFREQTIADVMASFQAFLENAVREPERGLEELEIVGAAQGRRLDASNETVQAFPRDRRVDELVATWAERTPDAPAVSDRGRTLSYRELDERARAVAARLESLGVGPEVPVAVLFERSAELVVAMLGVLKAGGAYVPLDPSYPDHRLAQMIEDAAVRFIITDGVMKSRLTAADLVVLDLDGIAAAAEGPPVAPRASAENVAYILYTSGSTGRPKGIAISHRAIHRMIFSDCATIVSEDCVAYVSNASFDAAPYEIWGALTNGARLVVFSREIVLSPRDLAAALAREGVTFMQLTTALFNLMAREEPDAFAGVHHLFFGGEQGDVASVRRVLAGRPPRRLIHGYGPAESTTITTAVSLELRHLEGSLPIGAPIANTRVYLLDERQRLVPPGAPGEIYIAGDGLARGYWGKPSLTAERFVPDPFSKVTGARLYRTGDLGRVRSDGQLEFVGRTDDQVKIRGHRIEPDEIRAVLRSHSAVRDAIVFGEKVGDGERTLVTFVVTDESVADLRRYLRGRLPGYMVPASIIRVDELPLTPNGKVDRDRLADLRSRAPLDAAPTAEPAEPGSPLERAIADIWHELLPGTSFGIDDDLFELGGHSLLASRICVRLQERVGLEVPLRLIFEAPTIRDLAARLKSSGVRGGAAGAAEPIGRARRERLMPLSFAQERMWLLDQLQPGNTAYHITLALRLEGRLDEAALSGAFADLVARHEALRTRFVTEEGELRQEVMEQTAFDLEIETVAKVDASDRDGELARRLATEVRRPFDLERGPLLRACLLRRDPYTHVLLFTMHHIVSDGWSMGILVGELGELYSARLERRAARLSAVEVGYLDYAVWQRRTLGGDVGASQVAYWRRQLTGAATMDLPTDRPRPAVQSHRGGRYEFEVPAELLRGLVALGQQHGATLFMTFMAAWSALLYRWSGQTDISVGTPIANRQRSELEGVVGLFVNTLVIRTDLSGSPSFAALLGRVREVALQAYAHQDLPFERVVEELNPPRDLSRPPLFQVMFTLQNAPASHLRLPELSVSPLPAHSATSKFDLSLNVADANGGAQASLEYCSDLFDASTIESMGRALFALAAGAVADPEARIEALPLLDAADRERQLAAWNQTGRDLAGAPTVHELIVQRAEEAPRAVALEWAGRRMTYGELVRRARRLAVALAKRGVGPDVVVAVGIDRSAEMVVACLATLMAGGAYLPIDLTNPEDRIRFMLDDSKAALLLIHAVDPTMGRSAVPVIDVGRLRPARPKARGAFDGGAPPLRQGNLAYVIYTSGSTGRPKGVAITHEGFSNYVRWAQGAYDVDRGTRSIVHSSLAFDLTVTSLWCPLAAGGTVELVDPADALDGLMSSLARDERPRLLKITPAHLAILMEALGEDALARRPDTLVVGGEALKTSVAQAWVKPGHATLVNEYGPTETVVGCCVHRADANSLVFDEIPIGGPIDNTSLFVLDAGLEPLPVGAVGELYIGGAGLARGYLGRPDLTAGAFLPNPFDAPGGRMYRTGDLVRRLSGGDLVYLGRRDGFIKLRGFRIELGEIETVLRAHPAVADAVVLVAAGAGQTDVLRAFVAPALAPPVLDELDTFLRERLPEHMMPSTFSSVLALPLTLNGKIDRAALLATEPSKSEARSTQAAPRGEIEREVMRACREILGVDVGATDDFFRVGGTSMAAVRLIGLIQRRLGRRLRVAEVFTARTVEKIASLLGDESRGAPSRLVTLGEETGALEPVFCAHPIGGSVGVYAELARHLGARGCIGLQAVEPQSDLPAMARACIADMRRVQRRGPFRLCGWSFGGALALEIAGQLTEAGEPVSHLALIDPAWFGEAVPSGHADLLDELASTWGVSIEDDVPSSLERRMEELTKKAAAVGAIPREWSAQEIRDRFEIFAANRQALRVYQPRPYAGRATVFWAANRPQEHRNAWNAILGRGVSQVLEADHRGVMSPPSIETIAATLA